MGARIANCCGWSIRRSVVPMSDISLHHTSGFAQAFVRSKGNTKAASFTPPSTGTVKERT